MEGIRDELLSKLDNRIAFEIPIFGGIPVPESVVVSWGIIVFLVLLSILFTRRLKKVPGRMQLIAEMFVGFINNFTKNTLGEHWRPFAAYFGTVGLYIGCANLCGVLGFNPPTKDLNVTAALSIMSAVLIYGASFKYNGLRGGLKKFAEPMALLAPINALEVIIRPLSLCMRLFGNVLGSFIIMELIKLIIPPVVPLALSMYFDVFDGIIQTIVFVFLTALFTKESLEA